MHTADDKPLEERVLDTPTTRTMVLRGKTAFCALIADPKAGFPRPIMIHKRKYGFLESEVIAWLRSQPRVEPPKPAAKFTGLADRKGKRPALGQREAETAAQ
jgi:predicted DNA-binding transcriptional regulator AlpA